MADDIYDENEVYEDGFTEGIEQTLRDADQIVHDMRENNALVTYAAAVRCEAVDALKTLSYADPEDSKEIRLLQAKITDYTRLCNYVKTTITDADAIEKDQGVPEHADTPEDTEDDFEALTGFDPED